MMSLGVYEDIYNSIKILGFGLELCLEILLKSLS